MQTLIVQSNESLGILWKRHLERLGVCVTVAQTGTEALRLIQSCEFDVIVLDLVLSDGCALTVADFADFRQPSASVVFVTDTTFFSDGSIFGLAANACAFIKSNTPRVIWPPSSNTMAPLAPPVRHIQTWFRVDRNDPVRINAFVAIVIMAHDMFHIHRLCDPRHLI